MHAPTARRTPPETEKQTMPGQQEFSIDHALVRRRFSRAAARYNEASVLAREVGRRMDERLEYIRVDPKHILDLGCGTGADLARLGERYPQAVRLGIDFAEPMLGRIARPSSLFKRLLHPARRSPMLACADAHALPLAPASMSLVWSNLMLNWLTDPLPAITEIHRILEIDGLMMFSTFGPDTLRQLREALPDHHGERVHRFIDMHDIGDALIKAGFSDPVMDMEMITMTYASVDEIFADLKLSGCSNASTARPRGLSGKTDWERARRGLEALRRDGRIPLSFELVQGHAWKVAPKTTADGRAVIHFEPRRGDRT